MLSSGRGEFLRDVRIVKAALLLRPSTRDEDLEVLAGKLRWRFHKGSPPPALMARAERAGLSLREELVKLSKTGLLLASDAMNVPQGIRLGEKWVVDDEGKIAVIRPDELTFPKRLQWFSAAARAAAKATWEDQNWPQPSGVAIPPENLAPLEGAVHELEKAVHEKEVRRTLLDDLIFREDFRKFLDQIARLDLTESEQEMLDALFRTGSWEEADRSLGLKPAAARKRRERLRKKLPPPPED